MAGRLLDPSFLAYVGELAMAEIVIKHVRRALQPARTAHHRHPLPDARGALAGSRRSGEIEIYVVGDHQVKQAVTVIIDEGAAGAPLLPISGNSCGFGKLFEGPVALIVIKTVLAVVGYVQIIEAVVVVIACAHTLSPAAGAQAGFFRDIGEGAVVIVVKQMIGWRMSVRRRLQRGAVHD